jgi:glycosyltransferase involved in cell wall biosynthesis
VDGRSAVPALAAASVLGAHFTATRVQFANRPFLNQVASHLGCHEQSPKALWLSDTYFDKNGVANSLQLMHRATRDYSLPVDFVVGADTATEADGLKVLSPCLNLDVPFYREQTLRFVNLLELDAHFFKGGYDRIVCSTEGPMGICALYLKMAHSVPAYFYLHTDWLEYAQRSLSLDARGLDYLRRSLRWFYQQFDGIFVLNREQQRWLCDRDMNIDPSKVHLTAHWCDPRFFPGPVDRSAISPELLPKSRVLLYSGRLSEEKGVLEIPAIYETVKAKCQDTQLMIAGTGPAEARLREAVPMRFLPDGLTRPSWPNCTGRRMCCCFLLVLTRSATAFWKP